MGRRLRVLVHPEVPGGAPRHVPGGGVRGRVERIRTRTSPVPFSFDLLMLERYWIERPAAYHHTAPILHIYALHEALRLVLEEGLEARWTRHAEAAEHLQGQLVAAGSSWPTRPVSSPRSPPFGCPTTWTARTSSYGCCASTASR